MLGNASHSPPFTFRSQASSFIRFAAFVCIFCFFVLPAQQRVFSRTSLLPVWGALPRPCGGAPVGTKPFRNAEEPEPRSQALGLPSAPRADSITVGSAVGALTLSDLPST